MCSDMFLMLPMLSAIRSMVSSCLCSISCCCSSCTMYSRWGESAVLGRREYLLGPALECCVGELGWRRLSLGWHKYQMLCYCYSTPHLISQSLKVSPTLICQSFLHPLHFLLGILYETFSNCQFCSINTKLCRILFDNLQYNQPL